MHSPQLPDRIPDDDGPRIVVVIDDQSASRAVVSRIVRSIDPAISVEGFAEPISALQWVKDNRPSLVITDYRMPQMDGIEVVRRLRAMESTAQTPIIMVTVVADKSVKRGALEAGATDFLTKPVDHDECRARCRNLLALSAYQWLLREKLVALEGHLSAVLDFAADGRLRENAPGAGIAAMEPLPDVRIDYRQLYELTSAITAIDTILRPVQRRILELEGTLRKPLQGDRSAGADPRDLARLFLPESQT